MTENHWKKRWIKIALLASLGAGVLGWGFYVFYFQPLPQGAVSILDELNAPTAGDRVLLFSPHPDDETIAAGGEIAIARRNGAEVWVVLVTDGNKHGMEAQRYQEFKNSLHILGVPEDHLTFLGYPDGMLQKQSRMDMQRVFSDIISRVQPTMLFAPYPQDDHKDHAATGTLMEAIAKERAIPLYQYLVHYPRFPLPDELNTNAYLLPPIRLLTIDHRWVKVSLPQTIEDRKQEAVLQYKTQLKNPILHDLLLGLVRKNELFAVPVSNTSP